MAERRPIVLIGGQLHELPTGDTLPGSGGGGGTTFLPSADLCEDTDATHFYFGWTSVSGGWLVRRQVRADASSQDATQTGANSAIADLTSAWATKETLEYV